MRAAPTGIMYKRVKVQTVNEDTLVAGCIDQSTYPIEIRVDTTPGGVRRPQPGDEWLVHRYYGFWSFGLCYGTPEPVVLDDQTNIVEQIVNLLVSLGVAEDETGGVYVSTPSPSMVTVVRTFSQIVPSTSWLISHDLGHYPVFSEVILSNGSTVIPEVKHTDTNTALLLFASPTSGEVTYI